MPTDHALALADPAEVDPADVPRLVAAVTTSMGIPLGYRPHLAQSVAHTMAARSRAMSRGTTIDVLNCGRRSGKSEWAAAEASTRFQLDLHDKMSGRGRWAGLGPQREWTPKGRSPDPFLNYGICAPVFANLRPLKQKFQRMLGLAKSGGMIVRQGESEWWLLGGIRVTWYSGQRPERIVADGFDGWLQDEAARCRSTVWEQNVAPALADSGGWAIFPSTPLGKGSWFYRLWALGDPDAAEDIRESTGEEIQTQPHVRCCHWTTLDNEASPRIIEEAERQRATMPEAWWRQNFAADWVSFVGQIFALLDGTHRDRTPVDARRLHQIAAGMDFGQASPGVFTVTGRDDLQRVQEIDSHGARGLDWDGDDAWRARDGQAPTTWTTIAYQLTQRATFAFGRDAWRRVPVYLPHDQPAVVRMFRGRGFNVQAADTAPGAKLRRLQWAQWHVSNAALVLRSRAMWSSWTSMRYPERAWGPEGELWDKRLSDDHGFDALCYSRTPELLDFDRPSADGSIGLWAVR